MRAALFLGMLLAATSGASGLGNLAQDLSQPLDPDSSEQAIEVEDDASLEGQAELVSREVASVKRALERINNHTYGECARCGAEISTERLAARPEAALCIDCARHE